MSRVADYLVDRVTRDKPNKLDEIKVKKAHPTLVEEISIKVEAKKAKKGVIHGAKI